ncbi:MAG TPA: flagellar export chaperone FliS [Pantanalinema sp.]
MNTMLANNPYSQYQQTQVETASPERLLLMLYDGAIRFANTAKKALEDKDFNTANTNCLKVQNILNELMVTLDMKVGGELAKNLFDLYDFMTRQTVQANIGKNPQLLTGVLDILKELREAWMQAAKNVGALKTAQATA